MTDEQPTPEEIQSSVEDLANGVLDYGACCVCERPPAEDFKVNTFMMMDFQGPQNFNGWGCLLCNLSATGAIAVLCDECAEKGQTEEIHIKYIAGGDYAASRERILLETFNRVPHVHARQKHPELWTDEEKKKWGPNSIETRFNIYHASGAIETGTVLWPEKPTLEELSSVICPLVGGSMERVNVLHEGAYTDMFVNEYGHNPDKPLPRNEQATAIYRGNWMAHHADAVAEELPWIAGPAVLFDRKVWS